MLFERLSQGIGYLIIRTLICIVQAMPLSVCEGGCRWMPFLFHDVLRLRARLIDDNLCHAYPELTVAERRKMARAMWHHLFLFVVEVAFAPRKIHETNWRNFFQLRNAPRLMRYLMEDRPLVMVSGHWGSFEVAGYVMGLLGFPSWTVARKLDNPYLDRFINRFRGSTGQHMIEKKGGYDQILDVLRRNGTMTFLADQYAGTKGCWIQFFGRPASTHKAIALLALDNDAPVAVGGAHRVGGALQYEMMTQGILDPRHDQQHWGSVREMTQWYSSQLELMIRQSPQQYWWLHRRWKDKRKKRAAERRKAA